MAPHLVSWYGLTKDEQALVKQVSPYKGGVTPKTRRYMRRALGHWSEFKFWSVQMSAARKGWPVKPTEDFVMVRGSKRPLYKLLAETGDILWYERFGRRYHDARTTTDRAVMRQGELEDTTSQPIFDAEQRLKVANNVLRGEPTAVPVGYSPNDLTLQIANDGNKVLSPSEIEEAVAALAKKHPRFR